MTDIENRLRDELKAEAQRAQPHMLRELRLPPRRRAAWAKPWLVPVAAVIAVAAVITGVRFATSDLHAPPAATAQGALPPFYVTTQSNGRTSTMLMIRRSADGAASDWNPARWTVSASHGGSGRNIPRSRSC